MSVKLCHKALCKAHYFSITLALGIEITSAFTAADGKTGEGIFEYLLKSKEFKNTKIYAGVETETALVGTYGTVELYTEAAVYLSYTLVINPGNTEDNNSFRLNKSFKKLICLILGMISYNTAKRFQHFCCCLNKFRLSGIFFLYGSNDLINIIHKFSSLVTT